MNHQLLNESNRLNLINMIEQLKLKVKDKTVFVTGHKDTDVDSYVSMLLTVKLLNSQGINAKPFLFYNYKKVDSLTKKVVENLGYLPIEQLDLEPKSFVFLVDHNNPFESTRNLDVEIVGIIDHHQDEDIQTIFKVVDKIGSTTELIYYIYESLKVPLDEKDLKAVLYSLCVDTCALMSSKATEIDKSFAKQLSERLNLNFNTIKSETLFETNLNMFPNELLLNGFKDFKINGYSVASSYIEVIKKTPKFNRRLKQVLKKSKETTYDLFLFIVCDYETGNTIIYYFGKLASIIENKNYSFIASRGSTIMPQIRFALEQFPPK